VKADLVFSTEEFQRRLGRARERMAERDLDVLLVHTPENIYYLTGYQTPGYYAYQCFIVPADGEPIMLTRLLEEGNVRALSWVERRATVADTEDPIEITRQVLTDGGWVGKRIGVEQSCWFLSTANLLKLTGLMPDAEFIDASGTVEAVRLIKSPAEVDYIRQAARATEKAIEMGMAAVAEGNDENDVAAAVHEGLILGGSEYYSLPPFVVSGDRTYLCHATWEGRELQPGDLVYIEVAGCVRRYGAPSLRCGALGEISSETRHLFDSVCRAFEYGLEEMRPGSTSGRVDAAVRRAFKEFDVEDLYDHRSGYSVGISFPPDWGEGHIMDLKAEDPAELKPGMVFHLCPSIFKWGVAGVACTETVMITDAGNEVITQAPRKLYQR
jgi:Xaa-Pro dipeptidase